MMCTHTPCLNWVSSIGDLYLCPNAFHTMQVSLSLYRVCVLNWASSIGDAYLCYNFHTVPPHGYLIELAAVMTFTCYNVGPPPPHAYLIELAALMTFTYVTMCQPPAYLIELAALVTLTWIVLYLHINPSSPSPQAQGASSIVYCACHPSMKGISGLYMYECWPVEPSPEAQDWHTAAALWNLSEDLVDKKTRTSDKDST